MEALVTCSQGVIRRIFACLVPYRKGRFMSRREGIGVGTVVLVIVSLFVALVGVGGVYLLVTDRLDGFLAGLGITRPDGEGSQGDTVATSEDKTELTAYAGLTWTELQSISQKIAAAPSDAEGISIAAEYGLCDSSGAIVSNATELVLSDNTLAYVQLVGIRQDRRADGSGVAGLTFMAYMISEQPMGATPSCAGGWSASALRSWLESESARSLLPDEMASVIVPVTKLTNNVGLTSSVSSVTTTDDSLWAFSAHEVCGDVSWFSHDYGSWYSDYDDVLNAEGGAVPVLLAAGRHLDLGCDRRACPHLPRVFQTVVVSITLPVLCRWQRRHRVFLSGKRVRISLFSRPVRFHGGCRCRLLRLELVWFLSSRARGPIIITRVQTYVSFALASAPLEMRKRMGLHPRHRASADSGRTSLRSAWATTSRSTIESSKAIAPVSRCSRVTSSA